MNAVPSDTPNVYTDKISPVKYRVNIGKSDGPFVLVFGEAFSEGWALEGDGIEIATHFPVNGYANGWLVESVEEGEYEIVYKPQRWFEYGLYISAVSLVITTVGLIALKRNEKNTI